MLQSQQIASDRTDDRIADAEVGSGSFEFVQQFLDLIRRRYSVVIFATAIMIALGIVYVFTTPPLYTANATLLIDTKKVQLFQQSMINDLSIDAATVESQVEILKSESIALAVIKKLHLAEDPEFIKPGGGLVGAVFSSVTGFLALIGASSEPEAANSEDVTTRRAVRAFQRRLNVKRVGLTYIIVISFESLNPDRAAQIANAIADVYIDDQLESKYQAARRAGVWLQERMRELREQATTAQRAVVDFKNKNSMVDAGGRTINEQQLAELNSELVIARSKTSEAHARVDRVQAILSSNSPEAAVDATVADTLKSEVINKLRTQYLELSRRAEDWSARYGSNHLAVVNLRNQMRETQSAIRNELQRIAESYKSDLEIAKQHEDGVQSQLDQAVAQSQVTNRAQVVLRELETNAQSYQALYDNFLQRYMESVQQQSFPITEARVISTATRPLNKSHPKTLLVMALATGVGLALGVLAGAWRDFADRVFRTRQQTEELLQTECIALVPKVTEAAQRATIFERGRELVHMMKGTRSTDPNKRTIVFRTGLFATVVAAPFSSFAESIRSVKLAIDLNPVGSGGKIIGFTSSIPDEGKSSIAAAVARLAAQADARVLLVDCDLRNPSLSRFLAPKAAVSLLDVVTGQSTLEKAIWRDETTKMDFLPTATTVRLAHSSDVLGSERMRVLFESLRQKYDYIIADFAPLMPIVDVRVSTNLVDAYVYVVEWGKTRVDFVQQALQSAKGIQERLLGVVLNKVELRSLGRYDGYGSFYNNGNYYHRYGYTE